MTIEYIEGFHALLKPAESYDLLWTACGDEESMFYLLNGDRYALCDLDEIDFDEIKPNLYFDTEWDCHQTAAAYYTIHCEPYPYMKEWNKCIRWNPDLKITDEIESETMVFK